MQSISKAETPFPFFNSSYLEKASSFASSLIQIHPIADYISKSLHRNAFTQITNRYSYLKSLMGSEHSSFIDVCTLKCTTCLSSQRMQRKTWKDGIQQSYYDYLEDWSFYLQSYLDQRRASSLAYLKECSYLVQDPHMMKNDIRRKMMKIPPPAMQYGTHEDQSETRLEQTVHTPVNLHSLLNIPIRRKQYDCLNTSIYDSRWGKISVRDGIIYFYQCDKPTDVKGNPNNIYFIVVDSIIPNMKSIWPMKPIQRYPIAAIEKIFLRRYYCQYSSLEFFYTLHNHHDSVLLYFPDQVFYLVFFYSRKHGMHSIKRLFHSFHLPVYIRKIMKVMKS